jgi:hypothetical protein
MPMPVVHLCVAKKLLEIISINDKPMFYLGSISPDSFYLAPTYYDLDGLYEKHKFTHLRSRDFGAWEGVVMEFIAGHKDSENYDFFLGYGVHILTDIYWKETVFLEFANKFATEKTYDKRREMYYSDAKQFDFELVEKFNLKSDVWGFLSGCEGVCADDLVNAHEVFTWKENLLGLYDERVENNSAINFFTYGKVSDFIKKAADKIAVSIGENV